MRTSFVVVAAVAAVAIIGLGAAPAVAQTSRAFVSGAGSDANPCSFSAPCRSLQQAHDTVVAGGEVVALDSAGYGALNITKAITVSAVGVDAGITSSSTSPALAINAGTGDHVTIRGVTLIAGPSSGDGIDINSAGSVTIRDCTLSDFAANGIVVQPSADLNVVLRGVSVDNSGGAGLSVVPKAEDGMLTMLVADSSFNGNLTRGIEVDVSASNTTLKATLHVTAEANRNSGIFVNNGSGSPAPVLMMTDSKLVNNGASGLRAQGPLQMFVDRTQISGNAVGWQALAFARVLSYKNNEVNGNGDDGLNGVIQLNSAE